MLIGISMQRTVFPTATTLKPYKHEDQSCRPVTTANDLPVNPSFLLHVPQTHRLRFFFSTLVELVSKWPEGRIESGERRGPSILPSELLSKMDEAPLESFRVGISILFELATGRVGAEAMWGRRSGEDESISSATVVSVGLVSTVDEAAFKSSSCSSGVCSAPVARRLTDGIAGVLEEA